MLGERVVTYEEMRRGLAKEELTEAQLREHWANLKIVGCGSPTAERRVDSLPDRCGPLPEVPPPTPMELSKDNTSTRIEL